MSSYIALYKASAICCCFFQHLADTWILFAIFSLISSYIPRKITLMVLVSDQGFYICHNFQQCAFCSGEGVRSGVCQAISDFQVGCPGPFLICLLTCFMSCVWAEKLLHFLMTVCSLVWDLRVIIRLWELSLVSQPLCSVALQSWQNEEHQIHVLIPKQKCVLVHEYNHNYSYVVPCQTEAVTLQDGVVPLNCCSCAGAKLLPCQCEAGLHAVTRLLLSHHHAFPWKRVCAKKTWVGTIRFMCMCAIHCSCGAEHPLKGRSHLRVKIVIVISRKWLEGLFGVNTALYSNS